MSKNVIGQSKEQSISDEIILLESENLYYILVYIFLVHVFILGEAVLRNSGFSSGAETTNRSLLKEWKYRPLSLQVWTPTFSQIFPED